jgi:uncharacterized membrane protein YedE/YeeE
MKPNPTPGATRTPTPEAGASGSAATRPRPGAMLAYFAIGAFLGILFIMSEVASFYRIQEMFRFQSFHMYGIIGSAVAVALVSIQLVKRLGLRDLSGEPIRIPPKAWGDSRIPGARYWIGGTLFGLGWALLGACPGPMFALVGGGLSIFLLGILSALAGTWCYALLRDRLPH